METRKITEGRKGRRKGKRNEEGGGRRQGKLSFLRRKAQRSHSVFLPGHTAFSGPDWVLGTSPLSFSAYKL